MEEKELQTPEVDNTTTETTESNYGFQEDGTYRVDVNNPPKPQEDAVQVQSTDEVPVRDGSEVSEQVQEENETE